MMAAVEFSVVSGFRACIGHSMVPEDGDDSGVVTPRRLSSAGDASP
jgi:hypothetical protein